MKTKMCIFGKIVSAVAIVVATSVAMPAYAVVDNTGCDNEYNLYINPDLALCSTHVYNIGKTQNPDNAATRQIMQDVVALKTTLMTQQMYSQYEILATTVKRLRTQLQKEVLLAKLKATSATANGGSYNDGNNGSSGTGNDKYVVLPNAENCLDLSGGSKPGLECLIRNLDKVVAAVNSGDVGSAKKQLKKDLETADMYEVKVTGKDKDGKLVELPASMGIDECKDTSSKRDVVSTCARRLKIAINNRLDVINQQKTQPRNPVYY